MEPGRGNPTGRFTLLVSPTLFALLFLLAMTLCDRQERQMDASLIHPSLAARLSAVLGAAAQVSSLVAGGVALYLWPAFRRFRSFEDAIAWYISVLTFLLGLAFWGMVV